jgi:hypothetical protein
LKPAASAAADDVEKVPRGAAAQPPLARSLLRVAADQPHEDRHEGQRQQHQPGRGEVDRADPAEHRERHDEGEHDLR